MLDWIEEHFPTIVILAVIIGGPVACNKSDWYQESQRVRAAEEQAKAQYEATPRVIREVDGCKVYAFKSTGNWHYFTRCANQTSTDTTNTHTVSSGKTSRTVTDITTIVTDNQEAK